eukprot:TRINITY_DN29623_c0_g1_i1.p1 TRINITY_DN29623_c0_g1~~TRINITY_DN29623_c0_g1_i1.p1  ORF type:complete len:175 (-),score=54.57 TRINITY_DN29623_c0_g1_i1:5-529(-)
MYELLLLCCFYFFFFSSRRRHTRCREVSWARRCVQETGYQRRVHGKERGISILFVSHKLSEVFEISENITIIRDGKKIGVYPTSELDNEKLVFIMTGRKLEYSPYICLLYTSDAADDTPCVDLGGRRIIKKKKTKKKRTRQATKEVRRSKKLEQHRGSRNQKIERKEQLHTEKQ